MPLRNPVQSYTHSYTLSFFSLQLILIRNIHLSFPLNHKTVIPLKGHRFFAFEKSTKNMLKVKSSYKASI